jgi:hypothetical protein
VIFGSRSLSLLQLRVSMSAPRALSTASKCACAVRCNLDAVADAAGTVLFALARWSHLLSLFLDVAFQPRNFAFAIRPPAPFKGFACSINLAAVENAKMMISALPRCLPFPVTKQLLFRSRKRSESVLELTAWPKSERHYDPLILDTRSGSNGPQWHNLLVTLRYYLLLLSRHCGLVQQLDFATLSRA